MEPRIQYARRPDGVRTAYAVMGSGPVLIVPPGGSTSLDWYLRDTPAHERFLGRLAEHRTVVLYDRHGCGLSDRDRTDFTSEDDMLDLDAVLEALSNPIVDFFGISWGGNPVLAYAARHPDRVRRLVLYGTYASGRAGAGEKFEAREAALEALRRSDRELYTKAEASKFFPSGADREMFQSLARMLFESTSPEMDEQLSGVNFDNQSVLGQITAPTLVIHRRGDQACLFEFGQYMARRMRNARFLPLDGDAHYPWVDDAESVLRPTIEFLTEAEKSKVGQPPYSTAATARPGAAVADIPPERRPEELANPQIQYTKTKDGVTIAYYAIGQGPPLVSMALPSHLQAERKLPGERRTGEDVSRIATFVRYDHRGFGLSERDCSAFPLDALVSDLEAVVDKLGLATFVLFARGGFTGPVAISYAAAHPERVSQLVLMLGFARIPPPFHQQAQALLLSTNDWRFGSESLMRLTLGWEDEEYSREFAALWREAATYDTFTAFWRDAGQWDVRDLLPSVVMPTLVINATQSRIAGPEQSREIASLMPDARVAIVDGTTAMERLAQIQTAIASFLPGPYTVRPEPATAATVRLRSDSVHTFAAGRYTVTRLLGEGGQKTVYLVHDAALERDCALALLKTEVLDADSLARVRREGLAMARLTHPNIVTVYDIGEEDGRPYLVCEYVPGGDLRHEVDRAGGPLPLKRALAIAEDVCSALAFAHSQGIIHRDVTPGNVHVARDGSAKLGDFGLALAADQSRLTMAGTAMGTAAYMAPEQARGQPVDARSDLYSLGCVLYEMVTGRPPFTGDSPMAVVSQHVHAVPEPPSQHNAEVSRDLEQLVLGLLAKAREERPSSAEETLVELKRIAAAS